MQHLPAITHPRFGLIRFRSPLLTESQLFSLPVGTEMFHFPTFPPHTLYIQVQVTRHHSCWVSPFGNPRITARLTAPRGISQPPTSFIGSWCQGIHRTLLHTYNKDARVHCAVLKQHTNNHVPLPPAPKTKLHEFRPMWQPRSLVVTSSSRKTLACSLRTQQCTDITTAGRRLSSHHTAMMLVSVPPMSTTGLHVNPKWLCSTPPDTCVRVRAERRSLERR
jgi:hypothetical protein